MSKLILSLLLGLLCLNFSFSQNYNALLIPKELKQNANAVVRDRQVKYEIIDKDQMHITGYWAVTVFNKDGVRHLDPYRHYDNSSRIKKIQAVIYDQNGEEIEKFRRNDFMDISAVSGGTLYSDNRVLYLDYTPVGYPFTMEFYYEETTPNTSFLMGHYFIEGYNVSTEKSTYEVVYDKAVGTPRVLEKNLDKEHIQIEQSAGRVAYSAKNLPAMKYEDLSPHFRKVSPYARVAFDYFHIEGKDGFASSWKELGSWVSESLVEGRQELSPETVAEVRELTKGLTDVYEISRRVYEYVQQQTRYISVQVGIGGWQPIAAIDVDEVKYGDCKGLTNYTMALLRAVGVESHYVIVHAGREQMQMEEDFPALIGPNHIILAIPYKDGYIWSDCTSKVHPFGFVGNFTDNRNVLVVKPEGGELVKTVSYLDDENALTTNAECVLKEDGGMEWEMTRTITGIQYDNNFQKWERTKDQEELKEWYAELWGYLNGLHLKTIDHEDNKDEVVLTELLKGDVGVYMSRAGDHLLMPLNAFSRNAYLPQRYRNRKLPFEVKRGYLDKDKIRYKIPEGYRPESIPDAVALETPFGTYEMSCELQEDGSLVYNRYFLLKHGNYQKEAYKEFRNFMKKVKAADQKKLLLVPDLEFAEN